MYRLVVFLFLSALSVSCSSSKDRKDFIRWVKDYDNGLRVRQAKGIWIMELQYQPAAFVALQRIPSSATKEQLNETIDKVSDSQYYTLTIEHENPQLDFIYAGVSDEAERQQKLYYFSYLFQDHITLREQDGTVLPCMLYHFEKTVDLRNSRTFVLAFENNLPLSEKATLIIDSPWLDQKPIEIEISKKNIPSLKI